MGGGAWELGSVFEISPPPQTLPETTPTPGKEQAWGLRRGRGWGAEGACEVGLIIPRMLGRKRHMWGGGEKKRHRKGERAGETPTPGRRGQNFLYWGVAIRREQHVLLGSWLDEGCPCAQQNSAGGVLRAGTFWGGG